MLYAHALKYFEKCSSITESARIFYFELLAYGLNPFRQRRERVCIARRSCHGA